MSTQTDSENRLFAWYRTYIGEPDREVDVYLGFALFFGAIGLAAAAFLVFLVSTGYAEPAVFAWRRVAFALGMVSLPVALGSVIVLLPVDRRGLVGGAVGAVVCLGAIVAFTQFYPNRWDVGSETYSLPVMFVYSVGVAALLASTGGALVAYHVNRLRPHPAEIEAQETDETEEYTTAEIQEDIDQAMEDVELTWGGVERTEGTALDLQIDETDIDVSGMQAQVDRVTSGSVDEQVDGLKAVKGGEEKVARSTSTVDDETAQLAELRRRRAEEEPQTEETFLESVLNRVRNALNR